jgi:DNA-binding transcriptional regulator YhcF (GntR family)
MTQQLRISVDREADIPLGVQLAWALGERISSGALRPGDRLPSVRELAAEAGVNVNTVRAVYARLEREGLTRSEQGRGTFVAPAPQADPAKADAAARRDLRRRIAALEAELVRRPQLPEEASAESRAPAPAGRLATTAELAQIHDELLRRLRRLDEDRAEIVSRLEELRAARAAAPPPELEPRSQPDPRSSASLKGARVRWVGA